MQVPKNGLSGETTAMRVTDDRYHRERQRFDLALRFIRHEARTHTIRQWTGLTDDRIRKLYRSYVRSADGPGVARHRGKSPRRVSHFLRSRETQQDAAGLASVLSLFGVVPAAQVTDATRQLPGVARGALLCDAFESFRRISSGSQISFEHAVFLSVALAGGHEIRLQRCRHCQTLGIAEPMSLRALRCLACDEPLRLPQREAPAPAPRPGAARGERTARLRDAAGP
jgi:hypothetical protein